MTQEQLLKMEHLSTAEVKPGMFVHIHAEDGYVITPWGEHEDIKEYSGSTCMWMPIRDSYDDDYRTITQAEHEELERRQREVLEREEKERELNRQ
jgi:hypothetical protein